MVGWFRLISCRENSRSLSKPIFNKEQLSSYADSPVALRGKCDVNVIGLDMKEIVRKFKQVPNLFYHKSLFEALKWVL